MSELEEELLAAPISGGRGPHHHPRTPGHGCLADDHVFPADTSVPPAVAQQVVLVSSLRFTTLLWGSNTSIIILTVQVGKLKAREGQGIAQRQRDQDESSGLLLPCLAAFQYRRLSVAGMFGPSWHLEVREDRSVL